MVNLLFIKNLNLTVTITQIVKYNIKMPKLVKILC